MKEKKSPVEPFSYLRALGIGLTVLSIGTAIAVIGYFLTTGGK